MALAADRLTKERIGKDYTFPVAASTKIYAGALVVLASGYAKGAVVATGLIAVGRADQQVDNSAGAAGDLRVKVRRGLFQFKNSASGDLIALTDIGTACYAVDDETVAKTNGSSSRSQAGIVRDVDAQGVWVEI